MNTAEIVEKTLNILNETLEAAGEEMDKLRAENTKLREALESIDTIARNTTKLTSPLYPATIKMIRKKVQQALKEK